jgi:hypothetical protein
MTLLTQYLCSRKPDGCSEFSQSESTFPPFRNDSRFIQQPMLLEISQGNSLCSYLYLKQEKMSFFSFSLFSSIKSETRRVEQVLRRVERFPLGGERWQGKGIRR